MTAATAEVKALMMRGSEGKLDYMVFARRGSIALGIKPNVIANGRVPGTTYVGARLRSATAGDLFKEIDDGNVTSIAHANLTPSKAWPTIEWEKKDGKRASTQIGIFLRGTPEKDPELLLQALNSGNLADKMADYLISLAGIENLILGRDDIVAWLKKFYEPIAEKIANKVKMQQQLDVEIGESIGVFGMQASLMKKVYQKLGPDEEDHEHGDADDEIPDADEGDEDKEDGS